jgi:hypothetical protein
MIYLSPVREFCNYLSHIYLALKATLFYCLMTKLLNMGDLTILGGSMRLAYYCSHYHNNSITNSFAQCFSIYDLTFVTGPHL